MNLQVSIQKNPLEYPALLRPQRDKSRVCKPEYIEPKKFVTPLQGNINPKPRIPKPPGQEWDKKGNGKIDWDDFLSEAPRGAGFF